MAKCRHCGTVVGAGELVCPLCGRPPLRVAVTRGLKTAGVCVLTLVVVMAIWGGFSGFHPAPIYGPGAPPGLTAAAICAFLSLVCWGPPVAVAGFVVGYVLGRSR